MPILFPTLCLKRVTDITLDLLKDISINTVLLDVDNTLAAPESMELFDGVLNWINTLKKANIKLIVISNNYRKRVEPFANSLDLPFICFAMKPLPFKIRKVYKGINRKQSEVLLVGDQIFTDILGANLSHIKSVLLEPVIKESEKITVNLRRFLEKPIRKKILKRS
ncbi:MAG: hypothetical protein RUMPE_00718 [Eubacteriales bacterium SKADARSKE-1]|nr:hypothetical protein [Eubacteriales bacterium SKADARSKE-1]